MLVSRRLAHRQSIVKAIKVRTSVFERTASGMSRDRSSELTVATLAITNDENSLSKQAKTMQESAGNFRHQQSHESDKPEFKPNDQMTDKRPLKNKQFGREYHRDGDVPERSSHKSIVTEIPLPTVPPEVRRVSTKEFNKVVIDLETSSRGDDAEICQIAATDGHDEFNVYIVPQHGISPGASAVNKLRTKRGLLFVGKRRVTAVRQNEALTQFLNWLKLKTPCLLIAHNARSFDARHLAKALSSSIEMTEFSQKVIGFSDTLTAFRERFPKRKSYSQTNLAKDLLSTSYNAHNALDDVRMLLQLVSKFIDDELLLKHSFTVSWLREYTSFAKQKNGNLKSLEPLLRSGTVSAGTVEKIAASGLHLGHLQFAFQKSGAEGLKNILTETFNDKPRVTSNRKILEDICRVFQE